jgi:hypothetical protein
VNKLVDALNGIGGGFSFSKDFVLKAGLMLAEIKSVGFKVENFDRANMATLMMNLSPNLTGSFTWGGSLAKKSVRFKTDI